MTLIPRVVSGMEDKNEEIENKLNAYFMCVSLNFDKEMRNCSNIRGQKAGLELVPLFLDTLLRDSCMTEVKLAFKKALDAVYVKTNPPITDNKKE